MILQYVVKVIIILLLVSVVILSWKTLEVHNSLENKDKRAGVIAFDWLALVGLAVYLLKIVVTW